MKELISQISDARYLAVENEPDLRMKEFLRALTIWPDARGKQFLSFSIECHGRSWYKQFLPGEAARIEAMRKDELANEITSWIQIAINAGALSLSNPPANGPTGRSLISDAAWAQMPPGSITTYVYDTGARRLGSVSNPPTR
jgi:hypothetical protein